LPPDGIFIMGNPGVCELFRFVLLKEGAGDQFAVAVKA